jgi:hypothetical protein
MEKYLQALECIFSSSTLSREARNLLIAAAEQPEMGGAGAASDALSLW